MQYLESSQIKEKIARLTVCLDKQAEKKISKVKVSIKIWIKDQTVTLKSEIQMSESILELHFSKEFNIAEK